MAEIIGFDPSMGQDIAVLPVQPEFSADKIAPSLAGIEASLDEYGNPEESYLFDERHENDYAKEKFGLNDAQSHELKRRMAERYDEAIRYWGPIYDLMEEDLRLYAAKDMWTDAAKSARVGRPTLTFPILKKFVKRSVGDTMRNPPGIKLSPRDDGDTYKANIGMGLVRYIEDRTGARFKYTHAFNSMVICGLGWNKGSYSSKRKEILLKKVSDPLFWYMDPEADEVDGSDANWFISKSKKTKNKQVVEVYEYWWREESDEEGKEWEVYWCLMEGSSIVDYGRFPGEIIPIFPYIGEVIKYRDEVVVKGLVRDLADAQRSYNYIKSQEIETIALTPKSPIVYEEGTIPKEYMADWMNCTKNPTKPLPFRMKNLEGDEAKFRPEFMQQKADTSWAQAAAAASLNDLKEVTGIYDTALGSDNKELSGKAIIAKQITADAGQYSFTENLNCTLQQIGRWIIGMIPIVMGTERSIRILGENGKVKTVDLDKPMGQNGGEGQVPMDLDFSEMDLSISAGNSYATRRQQSLDFFQDLMQAMPQTAAVLADLVVKDMDFDEAEEAARRLHAMLPPDVKSAEQAPDGYVPAAQLQQAMEMFNRTQETTTKVLAEKDAQIQSLQSELKNLTQARVQTEIIKGQYQLANTQMKEQGQNERKALEIQSRVETDTTRMQADLIKDIGKREQSAPPVVVVDNQQPSQRATPQQPSLDVEFKDPTISQGNMNREDMLMNL